MIQVRGGFLLVWHCCRFEKEELEIFMLRTIRRVTHILKASCINHACGRLNAQQESNGVLWQMSLTQADSVGAVSGQPEDDQSEEHEEDAGQCQDVTGEDDFSAEFKGELEHGEGVGVVFGHEHALGVHLDNLPQTRTLVVLLESRQVDAVLQCKVEVDALYSETNEMRSSCTSSNCTHGYLGQLILAL